MKQIRKNARELKKPPKISVFDGLLRNAKEGKYRYIIGIDTGVNTGLAVWDTKEKELIICKTMMIHEALDFIKEQNKKCHDNLFVRFEDARLRTWFDTHSEKEDRDKLQGAGSVKRDCKIWDDFLSDLKIPFEKVAPKRNTTKMPVETFSAITHYKGRTSEHARDAAMLVYGF